MIDGSIFREQRLKGLERKIESRRNSEHTSSGAYQYLTRIHCIRGKWYD